MAKPPEKLVRAYSKLRAVQNELWGGGVQDGAVSVDDMKDVVERLYGFKIKMIAVNFEAEHVVSLIERWPDQEATIAVRFGASDTLKRYATVKELCHLIADEPEDFQPDPQSTIEGLLYVHTLGLAQPKSNALRSEKLAEALADELMYDHRLVATDFKAFKAGETSLASLALRYKVPANLPSRVLRPLRMEISADIWRAVDAQRE